MKLSILFAAFILAATSLNAQMKFESKLTWSQVKAKALKENKMIFFDAFASWCGPCKYLENKVYTDKAVAAYFNQHFINVKIDMEEGEGLKLSKEFNIKAYPTLMFFSPKGKLVHKYIGAMDADEFVALGKDARNPSRQYFTLRESAEKGMLADSGYVSFVKSAISLEDEEGVAIVQNWLDKKTDLLSAEPVAQTLLELGKRIRPDQLSYLVKNKIRLRGLLKWDEYETNQKLYEIIFRLGLVEYENNSGSVDSFLQVINRYDKSMALKAETDIRARISIYIDNKTDDACKSICDAFTDENHKLSIDEIGTIYLTLNSEFSESNNQQFLKTIEGLPKVDNDTILAWQFLLRSVVLRNLGREDEAREYSQKALALERLPNKWKKMLQNS